ncbi:hypothetical protein GGI05_006725, partial [Coemansia sp. RSA 2603]
MTSPELSIGAEEALKKETMLSKAFGWIGRNPYDKHKNPEGIVNAGIATNAAIRPMLLDKLNSIAG